MHCNAEHLSNIITQGKCCFSVHLQWWKYAKQLDRLYLAYFWKAISLGMESGRITRTAVTTMVNLRSVYQWLLTVMSVSWVTAAITETENRNLRNAVQTESVKCILDLSRVPQYKLLYNVDNNTPFILNKCGMSVNFRNQREVTFLHCQHLRADKCVSHERHIHGLKKLSGVLLDALCSPQW